MRVIYYAISIILTAAMQTTLFNSWAVLGIKPILLLVIPVIIILQRGIIEGIILGIVCGLIMDILSAYTVGINTFLFFIICVLIALLCESFFRQKRVVAILFVFIASITYGTLYFLLRFGIFGQEGFLHFFTTKILIECAYTTIISIPMLTIMNRINDRLEGIS